MGFMDVLNQYANRSFESPPPDAGAHYQEVSTTAPPNVVSQGLAGAFRSDRTPPFAEMVQQLFGNSDATQRAGLLNTLIRALGPGILANTGLTDMKGRLNEGGSVTPDQAANVDPARVRDIAAEAERRNPSIIDAVSDFYAHHPGLVRTLGSLALSVALSHMAQRRSA